MTKRCPQCHSPQPHHKMSCSDPSNAARGMRIRLGMHEVAASEVIDTRTQDWLDKFQGDAADHAITQEWLRRLLDAVKVYALAKDTSRGSDAFYDMLRTAGILGATSSDPESPPPTEQDPPDDPPPDETLPQV